MGRQSIYSVIKNCSISPINGRLEINDIEQKSNAVYIIRQLTEIEENFWNRHVAAGIMPPPDGSSACDDVIEQYFHTAVNKDTVALVGFDEKLARREEILGMIAGLQKEQKQIEQEVKLFMGSS